MKATLKTNIGEVAVDGTPSEIKELLGIPVVNNTIIPETQPVYVSIEKPRDKVLPKPKEKAQDESLTCSKCSKQHKTRKTMWGGKCKGGCKTPKKAEKADEPAAEPEQAQDSDDCPDLPKWRSILGTSKPELFVRNLIDQQADETECLMELKARVREARADKGMTELEVISMCKRFYEWVMRA